MLGGSNESDVFLILAWNLKEMDHEQKMNKIEQNVRIGMYSIRNAKNII